MTRFPQAPAPPISRGFLRFFSAFGAISLLLGATACKTGTPPPAVEVRVVERIVEVQRPCPATKPERPAPLPRPLPTDSVQLAALLGLKLSEWSAPGGYGDRAEAALNLCIAKP